MDQNWVGQSDNAFMKLIGNYIQSNRLKQNKTQSQVSSLARISRSTLSLLERGENVKIETVIRVLRVLDLLHILDVFKYENQISPIEFAKLQGKARKRASNKKESDKQDEDLGW